MSTTNQNTSEAGARQHSAEFPQAAAGARRKCLTAKTGLLIGALFLGGLAPTRGATLFQQLQDAMDSLALGTNAVLGVSITLEPVTQTVLTGANVVLSVAATGPNLQYQWTLNGYPITGATNAVLPINNLQAEFCGAYQAVVFNGIDTDWSELAYLQVIAQPLPMTDNFASRGAITGLQGLGSGTTSGTTRESADPKPASGSVFQTTWMKWVAPATGPVHMDTVGSGFDTWLGVYTGTVQSNLVAVATDDDGGGFHTSSVNFNAQLGTTYQIMVASRSYATGPVLFSWNQVPGLAGFPTITAAPTNITAQAGSPAALSVQFQSTVTPTIQWYHNDKLIGGASQATLQWSQLKLADLGTYQVVLTSPQWTYEVPPVEIQFNSEGLTTVGARKKLPEAASAGLVGQ